MLLLPIINRIKELAPIFEGRVYGSAQLEEGLVTAEQIPTPTAFVMYDGDFSENNLEDTTQVQQVQERWTVVVVVANTDKRGQYASEQLHLVRRQLLNAVYGWEDWENDRAPVTYRGSLHIDMSSARLWHQFSFGHGIVLAKERVTECLEFPVPNVRGSPTPYPRGWEATGEPYYNVGTGESVGWPDTVPDDGTGENPDG